KKKPGITWQKSTFYLGATSELRGEIVSCRLTKNPYTLEKVYVMTIDCNRMHFSLCINEKDLYGEPQVGRRFRGIVWMQGEIHFN
ncbi:MAG: DUF3881 family protein, partial [Acidaminococcaceae bacterium]|nr:DUF3881 family protein [Acidaminococcaceae bacterium]